MLPCMAGGMDEAVHEILAVVDGRDGFGDKFPSRAIDDEGLTVVVDFGGGVEEGEDDEGEQFEDEGRVDGEAGACHG